jgi:hypothetical protein
MAVKITRPPTVRFVQIRNEWARDCRLGLKALGLLVYLHSHREGYELSTAQMVRDHTDGKDAVRTGLEELETHGYLTRVRDRDSGGRWGETDYVLADPFDAEGRIIRRPDAEEERITRQSGFSAPDDPRRITRPIEDQGEKTTPVPSGQGAEGRHLAPVPGEEGPTVNQRAQVLATEHYDGVGRLVPFMGIRSIVAAALAAGHGDEQVRAALGHLRRTNRTLTKNALGLLLAAPQNGRNVSNGGYGPRGFAPYRNPDPADPANAHAFEGPL